MSRISPLSSGSKYKLTKEAQEHAKYKLTKEAQEHAHSAEFLLALILNPENGNEMFHRNF
jgi:hypothetical protein